MTLPSDVAVERVPALLAALDVATARLLHAVKSADLDAPSNLAGWSRGTILAHLCYVAAATRRMTAGALDGRSEAMYPGGRETRPATLIPDTDIVRSLRDESAALAAHWATLRPDQWLVEIDEPELGRMPLSRLLVLRLTEVEVHSTDLGLAGLGPWSDVFVDVVVPLRIAWLPRLRRRPDADLSIDGTWMLTDGVDEWRVTVEGDDVRCETVDAEAAAPAASSCGLRGDRLSLAEMLLGRREPADLYTAGSVELARSFTRAFPFP